MEKVRIGIIGCGGIANGKHMPSLKKLPNVEMVAFCDIIEQRAIDAKAKYGTPDAAVYTDYKELLADTTIDVVHVCTPNRSHSFAKPPRLHAWPSRCPSCCKAADCCFPAIHRNAHHNRHRDNDAPTSAWNGLTADGSYSHRPVHP